MYGRHFHPLAPRLVFARRLFRSLFISSLLFFASIYALFSGLVFVGAMGLVLSPILHRTLHKFHIDDLDRIDKD